MEQFTSLLNETGRGSVLVGLVLFQGFIRRLENCFPRGALYIVTLIDERSNKHR